MSDYSDVHYEGQDGLHLYARDYQRDDAPLTILCMHGLTRNSADFEDLARHLHGKYRVIAADQRGRGKSAYDPDPANYHPGTYVGDMFTLLDHLDIPQVVTIGTSMGGLMSMIMCAMQPTRIAGLVINDIGPVVDPRGLARIKGYAGKSEPVASWREAAEQVREINVAAFPDNGPDDWMRFARRTFRENDQGIPVLDYDAAIAKPLDEAQDTAVPPDLWPAFEATRGRPVLVIRGENSDILAPETADQMCARHEGCTLVTIPGRGHAPMLDEPEALQAIGAFLEGLTG